MFKNQLFADIKRPYSLDDLNKVIKRIIKQNQLNKHREVYLCVNCGKAQYERFDSCCGSKLDLIRKT